MQPEQSSRNSKNTSPKKNPTYLISNLKETPQPATNKTCTSQLYKESSGYASRIENSNFEKLSSISPSPVISHLPESRLGSNISISSSNISTRPKLGSPLANLRSLEEGNIDSNEDFEKEDQERNNNNGDPFDQIIRDLLNQDKNGQPSTRKYPSPQQADLVSIENSSSNGILPLKIEIPRVENAGLVSGNGFVPGHNGSQINQWLPNALNDKVLTPQLDLASRQQIFMAQNRFNQMRNQQTNVKRPFPSFERNSLNKKPKMAENHSINNLTSKIESTSNSESNLNGINPTLNPQPSIINSNNIETLITSNYGKISNAGIQTFLDHQDRCLKNLLNATQKFDHSITEIRKDMQRVSHSKESQRIDTINLNFLEKFTAIQKKLDLIIQTIGLNGNLAAAAAVSMPLINLKNEFSSMKEMIIARVSDNLTAYYKLLLLNNFHEVINSTHGRSMQTQPTNPTLVQNNPNNPQSYSLRPNFNPIGVTNVNIHHGISNTNPLSKNSANLTNINNVNNLNDINQMLKNEWRTYDKRN